MIDVNKIKAKGITGILGIEEEGDTIKVKTLYGDEECKKSEVLLERCMVCKGKNHVAGDELLIPDEEAPEVPVSADRMAEVAKLEAMTEQERFDFWRSVSAAMHVVMHVQHVHAVPAYSITRSPALLPR